MDTFEPEQVRDKADEIADALKNLQTSYDARMLAPMLLIKAARLYASLVAADIQAPGQLPDIFDVALKEAQMKQEPPRIIYGANSGNRH